MSEISDALVSARQGDADAFARLVAPLRAELRAHCYRMLGSVHDADDALQDALVRAWRGLAGFAGRGSLRSWLYTVATRACLDVVEARGRRALPVDLGPAADYAGLGAPRTDVAWLGPYPGPDAAPDAPGAAPDAVYERRESVELAFVAALQHLPGNQRAALLMFDVLGFTAAEIAACMDTSVTSVNSALARARRIVAERVPPDGQRRALDGLGDARVREVAAEYAAALERGDAAGLVALLTEDVTWSMPPLAAWYAGRAQVMEFARAVPLGACPGWRHTLITANAQPAVACYLLDPATGAYGAWSINVLTLRAGDGRIAAITSFIDASWFPVFGLPDQAGAA